jgi:hypothetical protein
MKQITDVLMSKQFLIGLGIGVAGVYAYNMYMKKENTSNVSGVAKRYCPDCGGWIPCARSCESCCAIRKKYNIR